MPYVYGAAVFPKIDDFNPREEHELMLAYAHKQAKLLGFGHIARVFSLDPSRESIIERVQDADADRSSWSCLWYYDQGFMELYFTSEDDALKGRLGSERLNTAMDQLALTLGYAVMAVCGIGGVIAASWFVLEFCLDRLGLMKSFMTWWWDHRTKR